MSRLETPSNPDPSSGAYGGIRQMSGESTGTPQDIGGGGMGGASAQANASDMLQQAISTLRETDQKLVELSKSFPQAAKEIRNARMAMQTLTQRIVSQPGGGTPTTPVGEV